MSKSRIGLIIAGAMLAAGAASSALAGEVKGVIVTNNNGQLTLNTPAGSQTVQLSTLATVRSVSGPLGGQKSEQPVSALIPGLPVTIETDDMTGQGVKVEYKASDYKTAAQIAAGVEATAIKAQEAVDALQKVGQWNVRAEKSVYFASGSAAITAQGRRDLLALAKQASEFPGYMVSVLGYADPTGNAAFNQRLSNQRAQNVINLLKQSGSLDPGRVLSASAMGAVEYQGAADPSTYASDRRVTVRVVTSAAQLPPGQ